MLVIRQEQMQALGKYRLEQFEARMMTHLKQLMPEKCAALGAEGILEEIRHGMARAAEYAITAERDVARYLELSLRLGRDFDSNPSIPWARPILLDSASSAENRLRRLRSMARQHTQTTG